MMQKAPDRGPIVACRATTSILLGVLVGGAACSPSTPVVAPPRGGDVVSEAGPAIALPEGALRVPLIGQQEDYTCGNVAVLAVLRYWKADTFRTTTEADLVGPLGTTSRFGTEPAAIASFIGAQKGLSAEVRTDATTHELDRALANGEPVIVDVEAWPDETRASELRTWDDDYEDGHYVVLVGKANVPPSGEREAYVFMDPSTTDHYAYIPKDELIHRWHDTVRDGLGTMLRVQHLAIFVHNVGGLSPSPIAPRVRTVTPIH
jgi:predicted double-glycine peptidase